MQRTAMSTSVDSSQNMAARKTVRRLMELVLRIMICAPSKIPKKPDPT